MESKNKNRIKHGKGRNNEEEMTKNSKFFNILSIFENFKKYHFVKNIFIKERNQRE